MYALLVSPIVPLATGVVTELGLSLKISIEDARWAAGMRDGLLVELPGGAVPVAAAENTLFWTAGGSDQAEDSFMAEGAARGSSSGACLVFPSSSTLSQDSPWWTGISSDTVAHDVAQLEWLSGSAPDLGRFQGANRSILVG